MPPLWPAESDLMSLLLLFFKCDERRLSMVIICLCEWMPICFEHNGQLEESIEVDKCSFYAMNSRL